MIEHGQLLIDGVVTCPVCFETKGSKFCVCTKADLDALDVGWNSRPATADAFSDAVSRLDDGTATDDDRERVERYDERVLQVAWDNWQAACDAEARRHAEDGAA